MWRFQQCNSNVKENYIVNFPGPKIQAWQASTNPLIKSGLGHFWPKKAAKTLTNMSNWYWQNFLQLPNPLQTWWLKKIWLPHKSVPDHLPLRKDFCNCATTNYTWSITVYYKGTVKCQCLIFWPQSLSLLPYCRTRITSGFNQPYSLEHVGVQNRTTLKVTLSLCLKYPDIFAIKSFPETSHTHTLFVI
jgi:hypothetical protein